MQPSFFIIGFPRSATTALAHILDSATNATCHVEQSPKFRRASIDYQRGRIRNGRELLLQKKLPSIQETWNGTLIYGDKNPCLMPFIPDISTLWDSKFVFMTRDGRDCVSSLMNWHKHKAHNIFASSLDIEGQTEAPDPWDYSRMRPVEGTPVHAQWKKLGRFEQCAWYWNAYNERALDLFGKIAPNKWRRFDASEMTIEGLSGLFDFLELEGFNENLVEEMAHKRINSVKNRVGIVGDFPKWQEWENELTARFYTQAGEMMKHLGYLSPDPALTQEAS